jgi:hypothetical protein
LSPEKSITVDLDGDSIPDKIELFISGANIELAIEPNDTWYNAFVRVTINGKISEMKLGNVITYKADFFAVKLTDGKQAIVITPDMDLNGKLKYLYVVAYNNQALQLLPVPVMKEYNDRRSSS